MADKIGTASPEIATENSGNHEGTAVELWGKVCPQLEDALGLYDKRESAPDKTWNPLGSSKASYQQQIDKILDAVIRVLEISGAGECRKEIRTLYQAITESQQRIAKCHEQLLSAPPEASLALWEKPWKRSRESLEESIAAEERNIADIGRQIGELKERFRNELQQIGIEAFDDDIDSLLMPVAKDDFVSMAAVVGNISIYHLRATTYLLGVLDQGVTCPEFQGPRYFPQKPLRARQSGRRIGG